MKSERRANSNAKPRKPRDYSDRFENDAEGGLVAETLLAVTVTDIRPDSAIIGLKEKKIRKKLPSLMPK